MGFSRKEHWNGLSCAPPEDLPDPGMELESLKYAALAGGSLPLTPPKKTVRGPPQYYSQMLAGAESSGAWQGWGVYIQEG